MKDALVATVVHDLKNALVSLTSSTGDIAQRSVGSELETDTGRLHATTVALSQRLVGFLTLYRSNGTGLKAQLRDNSPEDFLREVADGLVLTPESVTIKTIAREPRAPFWYFDDYLTRMALEAAIHNGRLNRIEGFSEKKIGMIQVWLAQMLGSRHARAPARSLVAEPGIELLLAIDRQYRNQAEAGDLPTITPKRFNPRGEAWLPIWHVTKNGWHFTALYSNTARAHQLKRSHDWVLIYFYDDQHHEGQHTVVTETRGPLIDKRVVRGREAECLDYYAASGFS